MPRLRRSDPSAPGLARVRKDRGFHYLDAAGSHVIDAETLARIDALVIPPAWEEVWISPHPHGHIQAMGTDAAGRRQYRYHEEWRRKRDLEKFDRVLSLAEDLQAMRVVVADQLSQQGLTQQRVLACAARLLDIGFFRIGSEEYAEVNGTFGLATIRREHTRVDGDQVTFDYRAKSGKQTYRAIVDPQVAAVVSELLNRQEDPNLELLAFWDESAGDDGKPIGWTDVKSWDINRYLHEASGGADITAKDFRTWSATVLCAVALAVSHEAVTSPTAVKKAVTRAVQETAHYLGNTPAVCRASYIHPRVIDLFAGGVTVAEDLQALGEDAVFGQLAYQGPIEDAVLNLLRNPEASRAARRRQRILEAAATRTATGRDAPKGSRASGPTRTAGKKAA
ncbi:MAG TPA: DNA topoisomerase IB [Frankiaceae bacterium]|nr:DNA topoisomerase IB [Frankiaceae bacterium]